MTTAHNGGGKDAGDADRRFAVSLQSVMQFLKESQLDETLAALESESGMAYEESDNPLLPHSSVLSSALDLYTDYVDASKTDKAQEAEALLSDFHGASLSAKSCRVPIGSVGTDILGTSNPTQVRVGGETWEHADPLASLTSIVVGVSSADRRVRLLRVTPGCISSPTVDSAAVIAESAPLPAVAICLDMHPTIPGLVAVGLMNGSVHILHAPPSLWSTTTTFAETLELDHKALKWVMHCRFSPDGALLLTTSRDCTARIFRITPEKQCPKFSFVREVTLEAEIMAAEWTSSSDFVLGVRACYFLRRFRVVGDGEKDHKVEARERINLNATGDYVVSFNVLSLHANPSKNLLLVCTDASRVILYDVASGRQLRNYYGAVSDEYSMPVAAFSRDGGSVYGTSVQSGENGPCTVVWEISSQRLITRLKGHTKAIRAMSTHPDRELLITVGFDKTLRMYGAGD